MSTRIFLSGGPAELSLIEPVRNVDRLDQKIKVAFGAGYEHFAYHGQNQSVGEENLPVYNWCGRTKIAE
ncbi:MULTISPECIES: DUF5988 family protein [Crossiella]|uniref:Uncharacterized protein n=1 Tax=Crossiella cryophila TaxID=43355 RepID=A0A7W7CFC5_9PSEU|nr:MULTISPECIES: DUF5988 family protein [Crossiella]MBB4680202.1 hypothetical protein [Crossiella cryophila]MCK2241755.1 DUF5988 family protein [Crossiella sp. S99.2]MCK2255373.1 DUF5988 family protein [Crossiella sp. S99.1]